MTLCSNESILRRRNAAHANKESQVMRYTVAIYKLRSVPKLLECQLLRISIENI